MTAPTPELGRYVDALPSGSRALSSRMQARRPRALDWLGLGLGIATLVAARSIRRPGGAPVVGALGTAALGVGALSLLYGRRMRADHVRSTIRIQRDPQHLYRFWRELQNLPRFLQHVDTVETADQGISRWRGTGPGGAPLCWEVELIADEPDRRIAWCSRPDSPVFHCGSVRFETALGGRGTLVRMDLQSAWPTSGLVARAARFLGTGAKQRVEQDLRRFKALMETGEIPSPVQCWPS
jgi:uncharacterized membrane protein